MLAPWQVSYGNCCLLLCAGPTAGLCLDPIPEAFDLGLLNIASEMGMLEEGLSYHPMRHGLDKGIRDS